MDKILQKYSFTSIIDASQKELIVSLETRLFDGHKSGKDRQSIMIVDG